MTARKVTIWRQTPFRLGHESARLTTEGRGLGWTIRCACGWTTESARRPWATSLWLGHRLGVPMFVDVFTGKPI